MKYDVAKRKIETNGTNATKIKLKSGSKAFKILFGSIYKDIVKALVRELFTNGWDSQKMAGTLDIPIEIHAPAKFEPYFSIRDYGTGMTPEVVTNIYSMVFASTKDESNDQAGFMGMGSKTPLGYTDIFSLISYVDGMYYAYEIYTDEDGDPVINPQASGETIEKNGVFIQIPVEDKDIPHFTKMINDFVVMSDANVRIDGKKIKNEVNIVFKSSEGHFTYSSEIFSGAYLKMGCVLYPYNPSYSRNLPSNINIIMDFPIGSFEVTGSRDDVIYNDNVQELVKKAFDLYRTEYLDFFEAEMAKCKTYIEAHEFLHEKGKLAIQLRYNHEFKWRKRKVYISTYHNDYTHKIPHRGYKIQKMVKNWNRPKHQIKRNTDTLFMNKDRDKNAYVAFFDNGTNKNVHYKIQRYIESASHQKTIREKSNVIYVFVTGENRKSLNFLLLSYQMAFTEVVDISLLTDYKKPKKVVEKKKHIIRKCNSSYGPSCNYLDISSIGEEKYYYIRKNIDVHLVPNAVKYLNIKSVVLYAYDKDISFIQKNPDNFIDLIQEFKDKILQIDLNDKVIRSFFYHREANYKNKALMTIILDEEILQENHVLFDMKWFSDDQQKRIENVKTDLNDKMAEYKKLDCYDVIEVNSHNILYNLEFRKKFINILRKSGEIE